MVASIRSAFLIALLLVVSAPHARAQDLYDPTVLRTININFYDANWETLLRSNYVAQTNIFADMVVDGVTYPNIGVRIRGNTSYTALPSGSQKFSLNIEMDAVNTEQSLMGYSSLNFNNGFHDPTFCREVLYNNYVAQFIANPRANHIVLNLNGASWGVYINVQQFNKTMLAPHFPDTTGVRIKCANTPNGPGLRYAGATSASYTGYEIKDAGGLADPYAPLISVCNTLTNTALTNWQTALDPTFAVDKSIWSVVFENILTDDDSYVNKGADFMLYRNPTDGRMHLLQTDANETFTQINWAANLNFAATTKPFLNRALAVPELRQRYFAHYRTAKADLNWTYFGPKATALRTLIEPAVLADTKKLYTNANFQNNFASSVTLAGSGPAGGTVPGLQSFLTDRTTFLNNNVELNAVGPTISQVQISDSTPDPSDVVTITATVAGAGGFNVSKVELFYRPSPTGIYQRVLMTGNGLGQYGVVLPITATAGQRVSYYVAATSTNTYNSLSFSPAHTEWSPLTLEYTFGRSGGMRITEWMYSGGNGEFIEFTNMSAAPIDMTGWSFDDDHALAGAFSLSAFGIVQPRESVILTETAAATFRTAWNIPAETKIIGSLGVVGVGGNNIARNDTLHLYDATNNLIDRLTYGDQTFTGTIRTQNASGQTARASVGQDVVASWQKSAVADVYGSYASAGGDIGTPGRFNFCVGACPSDMDCSGSISIDDLFLYLNAFFAGSASADFNHADGVTIDDLFLFINAWFGGC